MARKVIIDCDPGVEDAVALAVALFDPRLEVLAVTGVAGEVQAEQSTQNIQAVIDHLDLARFPRVGAATPHETAPAVETPKMSGEDGLAGEAWNVPQLVHQHPSEKILCDELRTDPELVTIVCLGPLTNIARAFQRDPSLASTVGRIIILGGALNGIGNVTPAAEFNMFYDSESARTIFRSPTTKTLVPLDVTRAVTFGVDLINQLPPDSTRPGAFLRKLIMHSFRAHRQVFALESIYLHAAVGIMAAIHPELFEMRDMAGDVEVHGDLTAGATIFDRRPEFRPRANMEVAVDVDAAAVRDAVVRGLARIGK